METIGKYLKRIREEQGLSVEEVTGKTRISPIYIRALEENQLDQFPGEVFARGFVRVYGHCLGLDEDETMTRFNQTAEPFFRERDESKRNTEQTAELAKNRKVFQGRMVQFIVVAALGLSIVAVYNINSRHLKSGVEPADSIAEPMSEPETEPPALEEARPALGEPAVNKPALKEAEGSMPENVQIPPPGPVAGPPKPPSLENPPTVEKEPVPGIPPAEQGPAMAEKPAAVLKPVDPEPVNPEEKLPLIVNVPGNLPAPSPSAGGLVLVIEAVEASWVSAKIDGGDTKEVFLQPGQKVTW
jgi:cytoskeleton protein RodZ